MIALLQRVTAASVWVGREAIGAIDSGLLVFVGIARDDGATEVARLLRKILSYRVFDDASGRMNRSLNEVGGGLLLVPQFTLAADTRRGTRASFTPAAAPDHGRALFEQLARQAACLHDPVARGRFGAHMQVSLVNDGPVTFWLEVSPRAN